MFSWPVISRNQKSESHNIVAIHTYIICINHTNTHFGFPVPIYNPLFSHLGHTMPERAKSRYCDTTVKEKCIYHRRCDLSKKEGYVSGETLNRFFGVENEFEAMKEFRVCSWMEIRIRSAMEQCAVVRDTQRRTPIHHSLRLTPDPLNVDVIKKVSVQFQT